MNPRLEKYMGCTVEIIYMDRNQKITQRRVVFHSIQNNHIRAFCLEQRAPRSFKQENILAILPIHSTGLARWFKGRTG